MLVFKTPSLAYLEMLRRALESPDYVACPRGLPCRELADAAFRVLEPAPGSLITASETRNRTMAGYLETEVRLYMSGELRAGVWAEQASKFWAKLANPDGTINSNYGWLIFINRSLPGPSTPWEWAKRCLLADPDTRQAFLRFSLPHHQWHENKDQVCTLHMIFMKRNGRLNGTVVMRSCDLIRGLAYDMPWFCRLLIMMAEQTEIPLGMFTYIGHSLHLYERDIKLAKEMLGDV